MEVCESRYKSEERKVPIKVDDISSGYDSDMIGNAEEYQRKVSRAEYT